MNRYSGMTIWQLREELAAIKGELATRDVMPRPELTAKEQPGEQNAAPEVDRKDDSGSGTSDSASEKPSLPVAAPDTMVKRLLERAKDRDYILDAGYNRVLCESAFLPVDHWHLCALD